MVKETQIRVQNIIGELHREKHIDDMTKKWLSDPSRTNKPTPVGRPIISGCDGPTERISSFVDYILQPIAKTQKSYLKDTTDFINFIEMTKVPENTILVSMDVTSLYTNIPQEEGINTVCKTYEAFYQKNTPIPTHSLREMLKLILQENSKLMEPQWALRWQLLLQISLCPRLRQKLSTKAKQNHSGGNDTSMMYSLCGTLNERR